MKEINDNFVVIMAGGIGSRFWPFSRSTYPKQFHDVLGTGKSLIQQTVERFEGVCPVDQIYIVTSEEYFEITKSQLPQLKDDQILLEPYRRNTAPCIAFACYKISKINPNANILIAPSDHVILKQDVFKKIALDALESVSTRDVLLTLGITPTRPDTGYGYIQFYEGQKIENAPIELLKVKTFTEKPPVDLAKAFIESGDYVWNAGIFIWNAQSIIKALHLYLPDIAEIFADIQDYLSTDKEKEIIKKAYSQCTSISIDDGLMVKAAQENVFVVLCDFGWSDLGTWKSLYDVSDKDSDQNVVDANALIYNTQNSIIKTSPDQLTVISGLDNVIVAQYDNVLLVCDKDDEQRVKDFVKAAKEKGDEFV